MNKIYEFLNICSPMCSSSVLLGRDMGDHLQLPHVSSTAGREGNRIRDPQHRRYLTVRNDTPAAMPDDEQEASASGAAAGRPERAKTKSAKVYGPEWENE